MDYIGWKKLIQEDEIEMIFWGSLYNEENPNSMLEYPTSENYWSANAPIALEYYPYNGCDVF